MAKAKIQYTVGDEKEFVEIIQSMTGRFQVWEIWADFITMAACSISNTVDKQHSEAREKRYMQIISKYDKTEQGKFANLLGAVVEALDKKSDRDFLGDLYMHLDLGSHWKGQFFTPYSLCKMMANIETEDAVGQVLEKGWITVHDPACGAGATLIAAANELMEPLQKEGLNWQNHVLFIAQDIDAVTALMCYIQLSLLGCAGFVKIGDTLNEPMTEAEVAEELQKPESNYWFTPMYFSDVWQERWKWRHLDKLLNRQPKEPPKQVIVTEPKEPKNPPKSTEPNVSDNTQLSF